MILSPHGSPKKRSSSLSSSINTRIVPFISHYYSLLGDSPTSLVDLHGNVPELNLKWQVPGILIGGNVRIQGSTLLDDGSISIKCHKYESLINIFGNLPTINCKIPVEIIDINETTSEILTVSIHGNIVTNEERYLFFQVFHIQKTENNFFIRNNIFYVFSINMDLKLIRNLNSQSNLIDSFVTPQNSRTDFNELHKVEIYKNNNSHSNQIQTFPTYQDKKKAVKVKPQIKIHGLPKISSLADKDILSAISFQLKNSNEGFAIAIQRSKEDAIVQVDSIHSQELLCQRGIYIQGIKYKVTSNKKMDTKNSYSKKNSEETKQKSEDINRKNSKNEPDSEGWITVQYKSKHK